MSDFHQSKALRMAATAAVGVFLAQGPLASGQPRPPPPAAVQGAVAQPAVPATSPSELSGNRGIDNRLDRDEKTLRDLREIVLKAVASKQPVEVKEAGPDPQITDLQTKFDDFDQTLRRMTGQIETLSHDIDLANKAVADAAQADKALSARVDKLEATIQALQASPAAPAGPPGAAPPPGTLGQLPPAAAPALVIRPTGIIGSDHDEVVAYTNARTVLDTGDYAGGAVALQDYLSRYPTGQHVPEANYWLGRTLSLRDMPTDAAAAFARSLKGWPDASWAGDAVVRLSTTLVEMKRPDDACKALVEFDNRYAAKSPAAIKARAKDARTRAACS